MAKPVDGASPKVIDALRLVMQALEPLPLDAQWRVIDAARLLIAVDTPTTHITDDARPPGGRR